MSHRRRIRIIMGSPSALTLLSEGIERIEVVDPTVVNEGDPELVEIQESEMSNEQIDCVNNLGVEFAE